jgi:lysine N6-hydroxylase
VRGPTTIYDLIGIGLGPFNLGLACLTEPLADVDALFLESRDRFDWHPGMLLEDATLQVPFLADLVTMADPTSRWSFLNYLKEIGQLYPFYIKESFHPLRREYADYCRWAAERLPQLRFGRQVAAVDHDGHYRVFTSGGEVFHTRRLVLGIGTSPYVPAALSGLESAHSTAVATHSSDYLQHKERLQEQDSITIVGSGQSAAEIYHQLLAEAPSHDYQLTWLTRSPRFFPMEDSKLTLEMTSPEYAAHHRSLPVEVRDRLAREQRQLYKGISADLVDAIFDLHYQQRVQGVGPRTTLLTNTSVRGARSCPDGYRLDLHHDESDESFGLRTAGLVLATGYAPTVPELLAPIRHRIRWDERGRYDVSATYAVDVDGDSIFVQNAEEHTHSLIAPDLGMGAYRNSVIIAAITGREVYPIEKRIAVQTFGVPDRLRNQMSEAPA